LGTSFLLTKEYAAAATLMADRKKMVKELARMVCSNSYYKDHISPEWLQERNADLK